jgi:hypothetical protein
MRITPLFALFLCCSLSLGAQEYLAIQGKVMDAVTGKPLAFAHVGIPERGIGTLSGQDGSFTLKIAERFAGASLSASYMGYSTYERPLAALESPVLITLKPTPLSLREVIVMEESALENIIRRAVRRIPENYPDRPTSMLGFYRESRTDNQQEYVYLAEGVLDIYKTSYKKKDEGQTGLVQGRKMELAPPEEMSKKASFTAGHLAAHRFDFVKNRIDFIDEQYFPDYHYWLEGITEYGGSPAYVIAFDRAEGATRGRMKGKVYIDTLSYAFIRSEFELRPEALRQQSAYPLYSGSWKGNRYIVNYRKIGDTWHFSDAFREGAYRDGGMYSNEILITEVKPGRGKPVPYLERLEREQKFLTLASTYEPDFWKHYNTTPINEKLERSVQQLKNESIAATVFDSAFVAQRQLERDSLARLERELRPVESPTGSPLPLPRPAVPELPAQQKKAFRWRSQTTLGLGASLLATEPASFQMTYLARGDEEAILSLAGEMPASAFEPVGHLGFRVLFHPNFFVQYNHQRGLWRNIYREQGIGLGAQHNLSRQRPFFVRASAQYSRLRHASLIGTADNEYGRFRADSKRFNSNKVNMYYGSQFHNLNLGLELALELHRGLEIFARGEYRVGLSHQQHFYLKEKQLLFPSKGRVPLNSRTLAERNGQAFDGRAAEGLPLLFSVGVVFK